MTYMKSNTVQIKYNSNLNRLQIKNNNWTSKIYTKIKNHKFITTILVSLVIFSTFNIIMIFNFMKILQSISI